MKSNPERTSTLTSFAPPGTAPPFGPPRVALVHDWLTGMRGGERVLEVLCGMFPTADLYTLVYRPERVSARISRMRVTPSILQRMPGAARHYRWWLPIFPWAIERFNLSGYDLVISVSHAVAKGVRVAPGTPHLCYLLTPMRYMWDGFHDYFGPGRAPRPVGWAARALRPYLQTWDRRTSRRVSRFATVSRYVQAQARRLYDRQAEVIYPPVALERFRPGGVKADYYLTVGALAPNKRVERAVAAFTRLGLPLVVVGSGPEERRCRRLAGPTVRFLGEVDDAAVAGLYRGARALVLPGREDFGIAPVEAQASGTPVIALAAGGALETVTPDTGLLFHEPTPEGLAEAVRRFERMRERFDPEACVANAARFGTERFEAAFTEAVKATLDGAQV